MCGIWGSRIHIDNAIELVNKLRYRGPNGTQLLQVGSFWLGFTHLSINGTNGMQPIKYKNVALVCNGEIFNYKELAKEFDLTIPEGGSDCSILPELFHKCYPDVNRFCRVLDGEFAMLIVVENCFLAVRDPYGVRPLFHSRHKIFASEAKAFPRTGDSIEQVRPGTWTLNGVVTSYHEIPWIKQPVFGVLTYAKHALQTALESSVKKRLLSDKPVGALLSGGLDSSIVVAILANLSKERITTFSIGLADSPDLVWARKVSSFLATNHHEIIITESDYIDAIPAVIYAIESYDVTTVRASVGNWLVGKYIKENTDIKVVFNGDGSDEIGGGYRYFQRAPTDTDFDDECRRLLSDICYFDGLRSDRCISAHGLEPRTPYLDKEVVQTWLSIPTHLRRGPLEKEILRSAFRGYLPAEIIDRRKEAFSDGMSANAPWRLIHNEAEYYKDEFSRYYPLELIPYKWMPKWSPETSDPSARTLSIYAKQEDSKEEALYSIF